MADYIDIMVKVGDKVAAKGIKDGMPVCYIDPDEWGYQPVYTQDTKRIFNIIRAPKSWKVQIMTALKPISDSHQIDSVNMPEMNLKRERSAYIDFAALETETKIPNLVSDLRGGASVPVLNAQDYSLTTSILKDSQNYTGSGFADGNAITTGTGNVGSEQTYTTWSLAYSDLGNLTGTLTFIGKTGTTETASATITEDLNGNIFANRADTFVYGNATDTTYLVNINVDGNMFVVTCDGDGQYQFYDMYLKTIKNLTNNYHSIVQTDPTNGYLYLIYNSMIDKNTEQGSGIVTGANNGAQQIHDCMIWDQGGNVQGGILTFNTVSVGGARVENCTAYGCFRGFDGVNNAATWRNNASFGSGGPDFYDIGSATGETNASDDGSADDGNWASSVGNIIDQTASACFNSTDDTDLGFLDINPSGNLVSAGSINNLIRNTCIKGRPLPNQDGPFSFSIGSAELPRTGNIGRHHRNRRT